MATPLPPSPFLATPDRSEWDGTASHARILNAPQPATTAVVIKVTYQSCDGGRTRRQFKTLAGARKFAHDWVGAHPEIGSRYAVSGDGIGTVTVEGVTLQELFPASETESLSSTARDPDGCDDDGAY